MREWQEAMVWTSKESVAMVDGSATLSWRIIRVTMMKIRFSN